MIAFASLFLLAFPLLLIERYLIERYLLLHLLNNNIYLVVLS